MQRDAAFLLGETNTSFIACNLSESVRNDSDRAIPTNTGDNLDTLGSIRLTSKFAYFEQSIDA